MKNLDWIIAKRAAQHGVAYSQASMGHWTQEMYEKRCREIEEEFKEELADDRDN